MEARGVQPSPERSLWGGSAVAAPPHRDERVMGGLSGEPDPGTAAALLLETSCGQPGHDPALEEQHHDDQWQRHDDSSRHL